MDSALDKLQGLICNKKTTNQPLWSFNEQGKGFQKKQNIFFQKNKLHSL